MKYIRSNEALQVISKKVAVLFGGDSAEREVSLQSGERIYSALDAQGVACQLIDTRENLVQQLQDYMPDVVFIALHGRGGEDGTVQGLLETMGIPYTGSDVFASALAMDKYRSKLLWQSIGLPTPEFALVTDCDSLEYAESLLPAFVKPSMEGSSVGVARVERRDQLGSACELAGVSHRPVLVEALVDGPEFTVGILHGQALPVVKIMTESGFYDYEAKYLSDNTRYEIPCGLAQTQEQELQVLALTAFETLGCSGWGRVDFMQDQRGRFWILEVNTVPGMTDHSLVPMAAKVAGLSFEELVIEILKGANVC